MARQSLRGAAALRRCLRAAIHLLSYASAFSIGFFHFDE